MWLQLSQILFFLIFTFYFSSLKKFLFFNSNFFYQPLMHIFCSHNATSFQLFQEKLAIGKITSQLNKTENLIRYSSAGTKRGQFHLDLSHQQQLKSKFHISVKILFYICFYTRLQDIYPLLTLSQHLHCHMTTRFFRLEYCAPFYSRQFDLPLFID